MKESENNTMTDEEVREALAIRLDDYQRGAHRAGAHAAGAVSDIVERGIV